MKNNKIKLLAKVALILTASLFIQSCSVLKTNLIKGKTNKSVSKKAKSLNFDQKIFPKNAGVIDNMIAIVQPELAKNNRRTIAAQISKVIKKHKIEPQIIVAILDTESDFRANKISSTGDVSVAQINVEVWNKEFTRMKREPIDKQKLIINQEYALLKMVEILTILKSRYGKKDRHWYARYHSNTHKYKSEYLQKLDARLKMLANSYTLNFKIAENSLLKKRILQ